MQFGRCEPSDYAEEYFNRYPPEPDPTDEELEMESLEACDPGCERCGFSTTCLCGD